MDIPSTSVEVIQDKKQPQDESQTAKLDTAPSIDDKIATSMESVSITTSPITLKDLQGIPGLWYKLHVLIYDLWNFQAVTTSRKRLETVIDPSYIGPPYFSPAESNLMKSLQVNNNHSNETTTLAQLIEETLKERLERRIKKQVESGDFRVCAAHDVAPILEKVLGIKEKDLMRDKKLVKIMENYGLELGEGVEWHGLEKKGFAPRGKKGKGKKS
jgi:hypothetical protein